MGPRAASLRHLMRSTPVRQALALVAVVALANLLSLGGAYLTLRADLARSIRADLDAELASFDLSATPAALSAIVRARARAADPAKTVTVFLAADGRQVGNARATLDGGDIHLSPGDQPLGAAGYLHEVRPLSGGLLIVAESLAPIAELRRTFLSLLAFSLGPTVLISLGVGVLIARRTARRVDGIEETLDRLSAGDLSARLPPDPLPADDLSRIGAGVNRLAARQEAATEALRQVTADIAHDLRTPLQRISVLIQDLRARLPDEGDPAELADRASAEVDRAVSVFRAMLEIAQIEGGQASARFQPFDLGLTVRQVVELYQPSVEDAGHRLSLSCPETGPTVRGEPSLIAQALANLVENALRHTSEGSRIDIAVTADPPGLIVADDGPGVPEGERDKVLRRLYRLERSRTTPGHGLGLSLVAAIASLHGARLTLEDNAPGLRVRLAFPQAGGRVTGNSTPAQ
ncbi:HAMP domain-containing sensor histidine kinase [Rhodovulum kholense]|uniref:histidine kinase n=1 Tax=Rhodovulum kholense TaxID=453584 RepID=A0A8E2VP20_9RHOB|nr:HAMP domain-containing sensor histidine kinase [Rhodovulum kholense]PTW51269.1 signal transduction histidine kinase [Rhodovulum kholense]